jgi:hypothetical protein
MDRVIAPSGSQPQPWEQLRDESGPAYAAFLAYLELGPKRSFVAAARVVGKRESLLRRWAGRHRWRERAWQWDLQQARQDETVVRQQREIVLRERLEDVDRLGRACLVFFRTLIRRDAGTGEVAFDPRFTPQIALRFLELALRAQGALDRPSPEDKADARPPADLFALADAELAELIDLARQRADRHDARKDENNARDQVKTSQRDEQQERGEDATQSG